jgi:hypothetical protein
MPHAVQFVCPVFGQKFFFEMRDGRRDETMSTAQISILLEQQEIYVKTELD